MKGSSPSRPGPDLLDRQERAAKNQSLFREINERIRTLEANFNMASPVPTSDWFCECANESCLTRIPIPHKEYDAVREDGARFLVAAGDEHVWPDVEHITERNDQYWIVEKTGKLRGSPDTSIRALGHYW